MGCSSSRTMNNLKTEEDLNNKNHYKIRQNTFSILFAKYNNDINGKIKTEDLSDLTKFNSDIEKIKEINSFDVLSREEIKACLLDIAAQNTIKRIFNYKEYNLIEIFETVTEQIIKRSKNEKKNNLNRIIEKISRFVNLKQTGLVFETNDNFGFECWEAIFNVLKFNLSFQLEALNIEFNSELITNSFFNSNLKNLLETNFNIKSIFINIIDDFSKKENNIITLFDSICYSKTIKFLVLKYEQETLLSLNLEKTILHLIKLDFIYGLCLKNIKLTDSFIDDLSAIIHKLSNLKGLVIDTKFVNINKIDTLIRSITKNKSLFFIIFIGLKIPDNKIEDYRKLQEINRNIEFVDFLESLEF